MNSREEEIATSLDRLRKRVDLALAKAGRSDKVTVIAVTKTYPLSDVEILYSLGVRDFGENRDHEGREKSEAIPANWHYQGQIQSNKISSIAKWADVVHSLDDPRHLRRLNEEVSNEKKLSVFIQVCLDPAPGRGGVLPNAIAALAELALQTDSLKLEGLMAVAPFGEDPESAFSRLAQIHSKFRHQYPASPALSAGMSGDFETAILHGATHIRVGSSILGSRAYDR